jgi:hypothetical protein
MIDESARATAGKSAYSAIRSNAADSVAKRVCNIQIPIRIHRHAHRKRDRGLRSLTSIAIVATRSHCDIAGDSDQVCRTIDPANNMIANIRDVNVPLSVACHAQWH